MFTRYLAPVSSWSSSFGCFNGSNAEPLPGNFKCSIQVIKSFEDWILIWIINKYQDGQQHPHGPRRSFGVAVARATSSGILRGLGRQRSRAFQGVGSLLRLPLRDRSCETWREVFPLESSAREYLLCPSPRNQCHSPTGYRAKKGDCDGGWELEETVPGLLQESPASFAHRQCRQD